MNAYYQQNGKINSNNDIIEAYFSVRTRRAPLWKRIADRLLSVLALLVGILADARVRTLLRVGGVALCLVGFVGVIGAMESGSVSLLGGLLIGAALLSLEILALRR